MTAETYDDLKQCVGSKNNFTDDLLNMGYTKGEKDGYNQALEDMTKVLGTEPFSAYVMNIIRNWSEQLKK